MLLQEESKQLLKDMVLNCQLKDQEGLNDFQKLPDEQLPIAIPKVGISRFRLPILFNHPQGLSTHDCQAQVNISLAAGKTGINMSRLCQVLQEETLACPMSEALLEKIIQRLSLELRDDTSEEPIAHIQVIFDFNYALMQPSLKSDQWGWQYYACRISMEQSAPGVLKYFLTVNYEYSSSCPCSLSMAKQYELDFSRGVTKEGSGIATAHSQRSNAAVTVELISAKSELNSAQRVRDQFFIPELIALIRQAVPTETQSLVKRRDEQAFAILNGEHPMFVEHVSKRLSQALNEKLFIRDWLVEIEHFESLHSHNAAAVIYKNIPGGLKAGKLFIG